MSGNKLKGLIFDWVSKPLEYLLRRIFSVDKRIIVFNSRPDYSDNARALSEYMIDNGYLKKYNIYWVVEDPKKCRELNPEIEVNFISNKGLKRFSNLYLFTRANYIFATHVLPYYTTSNNRGQHFVNLWHGCGYKDKDYNHKKRKSDIPRFDKALVAGPLFVRTKSYCWNLPQEQIIAKGYPRYDWLIRPTRAAKSLCECMKGANSKVVIWMPTFRVDKYGLRNDSNNMVNFPLLQDEKDWVKLDEFCREEKIILIVKLHIYQKDYDVNWGKFLNIRNVSNSDFEKMGVSMYSFLAVTDGLISDYSSVAVDYIIVDKPIAFALEDYDLYNDSRGFVFENPKMYMPGHHLYDIEDLKNFLCDISANRDPFKMNRKRLYDNLIYRSKHYCKDIADILDL